MRVINARTDMHVNAHERQIVALQYRQRGGQIGIPDAMFAVFPAGVGFLAVAMPKAWVDA
ncbi:hypothetical protein D3C71_2078760 [compost metagenome]